MDSAAPYLKLVGRVLLSIMFIQSGVGKVFGYAGTEEHMNAAGVPGTLLPLVVVTEVGGAWAFYSLCGDRSRRFLRARRLVLPLSAGRHGPDDQLHEKHHYRRWVPRAGGRRPGRFRSR